MKEAIRINFFEQELRRLTGQCTGVENPVFAGRACYLDLGGDNRAKLLFITMGHADHYEALKVTVLNRMDGEMDALVFRFGDIWGAKPVHNPNFPSGVKPHIWSDGGSHDWYVYRPTDADFRQLAAAVSGYLSVFSDRSQQREKDSVTKKLREAAKAPKEPSNKKPMREKPKPER